MTVKVFYSQVFKCYTAIAKHDQAISIRHSATRYQAFIDAVNTLTYKCEDLRHV
jgi:hypothetical protein